MSRPALRAIPDGPSTALGGRATVPQPGEAAAGAAQAAIDHLVLAGEYRTPRSLRRAFAARQLLLDRVATAARRHWGRQRRALASGAADGPSAGGDPDGQAYRNELQRLIGLMRHYVDEQRRIDSGLIDRLYMSKAAVRFAFGQRQEAQRQLDLWLRVAVGANAPSPLPPGQSISASQLEDRVWVAVHRLHKNARRSPLPTWLQVGRCKVLVDNVSLAIQPGELVAIIGTSGCGKTSLLRMLAGASRADAGTVLLNGVRHCDLSPAQRSVIGYMPQHPTVHDHLPVRLALDFGWRLRIATRGAIDRDAAERAERIANVLRRLKLDDSAETLVHRLSGGEKKRVSLALELLAAPGLLLLDEPTSGLDPDLEPEVMDVLRDYARAGRTIVVVTHTLTSLDRCDLVAVMAPPGQLICFAPPAGAHVFFGLDRTPDNLTPSPSLAAVYPKLRDRNAAGLLRTAFEDSPDFQTNITTRLDRPTPVALRPSDAGSGRREASQTPPKPWRRQTWLICQRQAHLIVRDWRSLLLWVGQAPLLALLLRVVFAEHDIMVQGTIAGAIDAQRLIFSLIIVGFISGITTAAPEIAKEANVYRRERLAGLGIIPYVLSKVLLLAGACVVQSGLFVFLLFQRLPILPVVGPGFTFPTQGVLLPALAEVDVSLLLTWLAGAMVGLCLSALAKNPSRTTLLLLGPLLVQVLLAGVIVRLNSATEMLSTLSASRWALEAIGATVDLQHGDPAAAVHLAFAYERSASYLTASWGWLIAQIIVWFVLTMIVLRFTDGRWEQDL